MNNIRQTKPCDRGFTLVELLVVVAIIGILAGIVVPNVVRYLRKSRMAAAVSEIEGAETAFTGMLADAGRSRFSQFLTSDARKAINQVVNSNQIVTAQGIYGIYNSMSYELLRKGSGADDTDIGIRLRNSAGSLENLLKQFPNIIERDPSTGLPIPHPTLNNEILYNIFDNAVLAKLGTSYQDLSTDPWGKQYHFWLGPLAPGPVSFRSYRIPLPNRPFPYIYDDEAKGVLDAEVPGNPAADRGPGFPAPRDLAIYIFSEGPNQTIDSIVGQGLSDVEFRGGGDDPNNWDNKQGWNDAPQ